MGSLVITSQNAERNRACILIMTEVHGLAVKRILRGPIFEAVVRPFGSIVNIKQALRAIMCCLEFNFAQP